MKKRTVIILVLLFILVTSGTALGASYFHFSNQAQTLPEEVTLAGIDIGDLTQEQAKEKVLEKINNWLATPVQFNSNGETIEISLKDLNPIIDVDKPLEEIFLKEKKPFFPLSKNANASQVASYDLDVTWDEEKLSDTLKESLASLEKEPVDATFSINNQNQMVIVPGENGHVVDIEKLVNELTSIKIFQNPSPYQVELIPTTPAITAEKLESQKIEGLIASYTTWFNGNDLERTANVRLSAQALDGKVFAPGEVISFNDTVGQRTGERGYQDALIIVNGEFVPGLGGGICQTSSTLYNAGLLANLEIVERRNHGLAVGYVPLGRDATVAWGSIDLKIKNNTDGYILIRTKIGPNYLTMEVYGKKTPGQEVFITNEVNEVIPFETEIIQDPSLAPGTEIVKQGGQNGYIAYAYRTVKMNGEVVKTENLGRSYYIPTKRIVVKGPAPVNPPKSETPKTPEKPDPKPDPQPDPKPDPGNEPAPGNEPDPGSEPNPGNDPDPVDPGEGKPEGEE